MEYLNGVFSWQYGSKSRWSLLRGTHLSAFETERESDLRHFFYTGYYEI